MSAKNYVDPDTKRKAEKMLASGFLIREICKELDVSLGFVGKMRQRLKRDGQLADHETMKAVRKADADKAKARKSIMEKRIKLLTLDSFIKPPTLERLMAGK